MSPTRDKLSVEKIIDHRSTDEAEEKKENLSLSEAGETFKDLYEESLQEVREEGIVRGRVIHVGADFVTIDVGLKSEGQIPLGEFLNKADSSSVDVGDAVDVCIEGKNPETGLISLSKKKADQLKFWEKVDHAWSEDQVIEGTIVSPLKGGFAVDIGIPAFLPGSQVDIRPARNAEQFIGKSFNFKIIKLNRERGNVVLSRRMLLEKEQETLRRKTLETLEEGKVVEGTVKNMTDYGAFIDLGGIDGMLHINDISWGRIKHPSDILALDSKVKVKVLHFEREKHHVSLGRKQLFPDPWENVAEKYEVGARVKGRVTSIVDYGAFVQLQEGVTGLVHVSAIPWSRRSRSPSEILSIGEEVEVMVMSIDPAKKRISLSLKHPALNPWETIAEKYPVGTKIKGQIKNITDFGVFVGIDQGIDALVRISDISWVHRLKHPSEIFKKGEEVQAIVLNIDKEKQRFSLGIKQAQKNPWDDVHHRFKVGQLIKGRVTTVMKFGAFVEVEPGIEGLVHISALSHERVEQTTEVVQVGDEIQAVVISVEPGKHRIGLSIKDVD
jgi:small subunit ribosomal protein S1